MRTILRSKIRPAWSGRPMPTLSWMTWSKKICPVRENWLTAAFRGLDATLERLRVDWQFDEALTCGPDPLHLTAAFGLDDNTAIHYATAAR